MTTATGGSVSSPLNKATKVDFYTNSSYLLEAFTELAIANNTIVLFTSDNGPFVTRPEPTWTEQAVGSAYPYRGYKRIAQEGGPRVPLLVRYPGQVAAGAVTGGLASNIDLLPTLLSLSGGEIPTDRTLDGVDLWPLMNGSTSTSPRSEFFYYEENASGNGLYDPATDIQESSNVSGSKGRATVTSLSSALSSHNSSTSRRSRGLPQSNQIEIRKSAADRENTNTVAITGGGTATFEVRLANSANTTVSISRFSGDGDLTVQSGGSLTFTTGNYNVWQTVTLAASEDLDTSSNGATFSASSGSMHVREIFALETDTGSNDPPPPAEAPLPAQISGLVGWYDAQTFEDADGTETVTVRLTTPLDADGRQFIRVRVTQN